MLLFTDLSYQTGIDLSTTLYTPDRILGYTPDDSIIAVQIMQYFPYIKANVDKDKNIISVEYFVSDEQKKIERKIEILEELDTLDREAVRPLRAILTGNYVEADKLKLEEIEADAIKLRAELKELSD